MTEQPSKRRGLILIVEDEPGIRDALGMLLELEGFEVALASDPVHALELLPDIDCDLIITDQMMPRMDGTTFLATVRRQERLRGIPTLMMSAVHRPTSSVTSNADAFVAKPFAAARLLATIDRLLAGR